MLIAHSERLTRSVSAAESQRIDGPFVCPQCESPVFLRRCRERRDHFYHARESSCAYGKGESLEHQEAKVAIYEACKKSPRYSLSVLEYSMKVGRRTDVLVRSRNGYVAVEIQRSKLGLDALIQRTWDMSSPAEHPSVVWISYRPGWIEEGLSRRSISELTAVEEFTLGLCGHFVVWAGEDQVQVWIRRGALVFRSKNRRIYEFTQAHFHGFSLGVDPNVQTHDLVSRTFSGQTYESRADASWSVFLLSLGLDFRYFPDAQHAGAEFEIPVFSLYGIEGGLWLSTSPRFEDCESFARNTETDVLHFDDFPTAESIEILPSSAIVESTRIFENDGCDHGHFFCRCSCGTWGIQYCGQANLERMKHECKGGALTAESVAQALQEAFEAAWSWRRKTEWAHDDAQKTVARLGDFIARRRT